MLSGLGRFQLLSLGTGFIWAILLFSAASPDLPHYCLWIIIIIIFSLREMLRYGLEEISDLVKSLLPKLEIPEYFNSSG